MTVFFPLNQSRQWHSSRTYILWMSSERSSRKAAAGLRGSARAPCSQVDDPAARASYRFLLMGRPFKKPPRTRPETTCWSSDVTRNRPPPHCSQVAVVPSRLLWFRHVSQHGCWFYWFGFWRKRVNYYYLILLLLLLCSF